MGHPSTHSRVPVLTKGADELGLDGPGDPLHQAQGGEPREPHVVEEDDVEVPQPVETAKVPQEVETGDPWGRGGGGLVVRAPQSWGHPSSGVTLASPRGSPSVLEKTGRAELSTSKETQFPMIWGGRKESLSRVGGWQCCHREWDPPPPPPPKLGKGVPSVRHPPGPCLHPGLHRRQGEVGGGDTTHVVLAWGQCAGTHATMHCGVLHPQEGVGNPPSPSPALSPW